MRVVHLTWSPVAGSPWNIVTALNAHTSIVARLVVLNPNAYGQRTFPNDLIWGRDRDACLEALAAADVVHLHQWFDPVEAFGPEISAVCARKPFLRQWHSIPAHFVGNNAAAIDRVVNDPIPQLVIAQYPERYYPRARIVPNIVPLDDGLLAKVSGGLNKVSHIAWSPSGRESAWAQRWGTKGYPETLHLLKRISREEQCTVDVIENMPRDECLRRKAGASLVIDDLVTGSYHLSSLESLAQGKPVLCWLDERVQVVIRELTGAVALPWVNVHLEDAENVLRFLLADPELCAAIGAESHAWMERWYNDRVLVNHYVQAYNDLLERPDLFARAREIDIAAHWRNVRLPDAIWEARRQRAQTADKNSREMARPRCESVEAKLMVNSNNGTCSSDDAIGDVCIDSEQTADQIVMCCGLGKTLDIGSGNGALIASLLRRGVDAHGVDASDVMVSLCNQRLPARFTHGSVLSLPFQDGSFYTVVSTECMEHLAPEDVPTALKEIHRVAGRYVFFKIATTQDQENELPVIVEGRAWWEVKCFEAGFRKHPAYYRLNAYSSLNQEGRQIVIPLEKIPANALVLYPLAALRQERDLHMDMLREQGSRSDAHVARYHFSCKYIRPGDIVLDAACGLGYGSHVIRSMTKCSSVTGIDGSAYGVDYANANFSDDSTIRFMQDFLPDCLQHIPDNSIDIVICFETLGHVEAPTTVLAEFYRILTPGGRLIASVPHDWSDETGQDPNPVHLHVYDRIKFVSELTQFFEIEQLVGQTADRIKKPGETCEWVPRPRSFTEIDLLCEETPVEAEWLLAVACKSPLSGSDIPYVEKVFSQEEQTASGNALAFARDYENPWLVRSLVSIGLRTENRRLRERWAIETMRRAHVTSADYGAALCVLAYLALEGSIVTQQMEFIEAIDQYISIKLANNPNVLRWQVSLSYVRGVMELAHGRRDNAKQCFHRVIAFPVATYSPTLLTKPAEAAYQLGLLYAADGELDEAELVLRTSVNELLKEIGKHLSSPYPALPPEFELREIATALTLIGRLAAAALNVKSLNYQPSVFHDEVNADTAARLLWIETQHASWEKIATEREQSIIALQAHVQDLVTGNNWLESQRTTWEKTAVEREQSMAVLQAQVQDLLAGKDWLSSQRDSWEKTATERERSIVTLQTQVKNLLTDKDWLSSQRDAWEKIAAERDQAITALQTQVQELLTSEDSLSSQRDAWEKIAAERDQSILALQSQAQDLLANNTLLTSRLQEAVERIAARDAVLNKIRNHWGMRCVNYLSRRKLF